MVIVYGDLPDEFSDKAFVEFCDFGLLASDEVLKLSDALLPFFAAACIGLGL